MRLDEAGSAHIDRSFPERLFVRTPVLSPSGHARAFDDTYAWIRAKMPLVPITRVTDLTPLDYLGLPVWSAITPLAKDLTTHVGKGRTHVAARISAIMEAIERTSGESLAPGRVMRASHEDLSAARPHGFGPVDVARFNLPFDTRYTPARSFEWVDAYDLIQRAHFWVPVDLVISPPMEGVCQGIETNGLASGNTLTEATVHALYELVERYSEMQCEFMDRFADPSDRAFRRSRMIDPHTLPTDSLEWVKRIEDRGIRLTIRDETCELGVSVFRARMHDPQFPLRDSRDMALDGFGADLRANQAVLRAITEVVQSHTGFIHGARDTFEGTEGYAARTHSWRRLVEMKRPIAPLPFVPSEDAPRGLDEDLATLIEKLRAHGFAHCLAVDVTRPDLEVPVVRVLVPDMVTIESSRRPPLRCLASLV